MHRQINTHWTSLVVKSFHSFTLSVISLFTFQSAAGYLEIHLRAHQLWSSLKDIFTFFVILYVPLKVIQSKEKLKKQSTFVWQTLSSPHMMSSPYMWYRRGRSIQTEVMRSVFWLNAIIPTPKVKSCGEIQWGRGLLWFHSVYIMPTGRWSCLGPLGLRLLWFIVEIWTGWTKCHSHTYVIRINNAHI